jgi:hypothetical protein
MYYADETEASGMARPLEFEVVIECEDPAAEVERLLSARPSEAALRTIREAEALDLNCLEVDLPDAPRTTR